MSLFKDWNDLSDNHDSQEAEVKFWEEYLKVEANIYNEILNEKMNLLEGKLSDLAIKFNTTDVLFMGFIDGVNESLEEELNLDEIESDTEVSLKINWEKLFFNMVNVEAHWLYGLKGWENILSEDHRKQVIKDYKKSKTVVKEVKIGRNDPCPCGSGKKYKKCCGK